MLRKYNPLRFFTFPCGSVEVNCYDFVALDFDSTLGDEVDIPLPSAESREEVDEVDEEIEEELEGQEDEKEETGEDGSEEERAESGAETSEGDQVVVTGRSSRSKSAMKVKKPEYQC